MGILVESGRLVYPKEVVVELERVADPRSPDAQYAWAKQFESIATARAASLEDVKTILAVVPDVLDADKDLGPDEADPYILAYAVRLRNGGNDARIITEEKNDTPRKMSLNTAAGLLGLASVPLRAFLQFERIA
jgi:hypothetical protein